MVNVCKDDRSNVRLGSRRDGGLKLDSRLEGIGSIFMKALKRFRSLGEISSERQCRINTQNVRIMKSLPGLKSPPKYSFI
jgi:hypothetical protein